MTPQQQIANATEKAIAFFLEHAVNHTHPPTPATLRAERLAAEELATAKVWATLAGYTFERDPDPDAESLDRAIFSEEEREDAGKAWQLGMYDEEGTLVQSLSGCYGGQDYERVVAAQLALQEMQEKEGD